MVDILVIGAGVMAGNQVRAFRSVPGANIVAVVSPHEAGRKAFADEHGIPAEFEQLSDALGWGKFEAATNVSPDPVHHPTTMMLLAAGKHVLCEKPLSVSYELADEMALAAEAAGLINMVNLSYRDSPALQEVRRRVLAGELGEIRHFSASYLQSWLVGDAWQTQRRRLLKVSSPHSGLLGTLGDTGVHILDFLTFATGADVVDLDCRLKTFAKVEGGRIGEFAVDVNDTYLLDIALDNGAVGNVAGTRLAAGHLNDVRLSLYGTTGAFDVFTNGRSSSLKACVGEDIGTATWVDVACPPTMNIYSRFISGIQNGTNQVPDFRAGAKVQRLIDQALAAGERHFAD